MNNYFRHNNSTGMHSKGQVCVITLAFQSPLGSFDMWAQKDVLGRSLGIPISLEFMVVEGQTSCMWVSTDPHSQTCDHSGSPYSPALGPGVGPGGRSSLCALKWLSPESISLLCWGATLISQPASGYLEQLLPPGVHSTLSSYRASKLVPRRL